ncbi:MAG: undecaprenyl-diphosphate phosphatase, partial [Cetobacterium sp.]
RGVAAEYSFFLAIPTMAGATLLKILKNGLTFNTQEWQLLGLGTIVSFVVAYVVIKWFMGYIKTKTFKVFGIYRVILGILVLLLMR